MRLKKILILSLAVLPLFAAAQVPSYVPSNGLVGWWPFNGNANDESGNGNNGTVNGATLTTDRNGNSNAAYSFDGSSNYIEATSNSSLQVSSAYTMSLWFNSNIFNNGPYGYTLISKIAYTGWYGGYEIMIGESNSIGGVNHTGNINGNFQLPFLGMNAGNWYSVIATFNGNQLKLYVNGSLVNTVTQSGALQIGNDPLRFGRRGGGGIYDQFYNGSLDDIGIWNRALTPCEIQALYNSGVGGTTVASSASYICEGSSVSLTASGPATYSWMPGNLTGDSLSVTPVVTTTYTVTGTDSAGCTSIDSVTVTVNPLPQVSAGSTTTNYCLSDASGNLVGVPTSGTWSGPGVTGSTFTPSAAGAGTHNVIYTYTDNSGCSNSDTLIMTVDLCTDIHEANNSAFTIFPNPANTTITVSWSQPNIKTLTLTDAAGRAVRTYNVTGTQAQLSLEGLASGVYFLSGDGEEKAVQKIIKQ